MKKAEHSQSLDSLKSLKNVEVPTAGEAAGDAVGVDVPNPHQYTGAIIGGGAAGTVITIAVFCVASYFCYKWNSEMKEKGEEAHCGLLSCLCCVCCTPIVCCFPIDGKCEEKKADAPAAAGAGRQPKAKAAAGGGGGGNRLQRADFDVNQ